MKNVMPPWKKKRSIVYDLDICDNKYVCLCQKHMLCSTGLRTPLQIRQQNYYTIYKHVTIITDFQLFFDSEQTSWWLLFSTSGFFIGVENKNKRQGGHLE